MSWSSKQMVGDEFRLFRLRSLFGQKASQPGRAPAYYSHAEAKIWLDGYTYAMEEAQQAAVAELREAMMSRPDTPES
jgi:hypothetical protein